jgi:hypothetical protein
VKPPRSRWAGDLELTAHRAVLVRLGSYWALALHGDGQVRAHRQPEGWTARWWGVAVGDGPHCHVYGFDYGTGASRAPGD